MVEAAEEVAVALVAEALEPETLEAVLDTAAVLEALETVAVVW